MRLMQAIVQGTVCGVHHRFFGGGGSLSQAAQRAPQKTLSFSQRPPKKHGPGAFFLGGGARRGVCASLPAAPLPVDATHVAAVPSTPAAISAKPP
jgi:hypothetical protein